MLAASVKYLSSQLATGITMSNDYRAEFFRISGRV